VDPILEAGFDEAMMGLYVRAKTEANYTATYYHQMLEEHRGVETARRLVMSETPSDGYTAMWERRKLGLTVEALVIQPEWAAVFADEPEVTERARQRLTEYGYFDEAEG